MGAKEVHITMQLLGDDHAAHRIGCARFNDCNIMTLALKALNCWRQFHLPLTVFSGGDNDTYVLY